MATLLAVCEPGVVRRRWRAALARPHSPHRLAAETDDPDEAERLLADIRPDVVLLELSRPLEQSTSLCRRLVEAGNAAGRDIPVVALAPMLDDAERALLLDAGATGYLLTTIDSSSLAIALQAIADVASSEDGQPPRAEARSRADFLRWTGVAAAAALLLPGQSRAQEPGTRPSPSSPQSLPDLPPPSEGESDLLRMQRELVRSMRKPVGERKWVMVIDPRKCSGCDACTIACNAENQLPPGVVYRPVVKEVVGTYPNVRQSFLPRPCMQCENPPCTPVCPVGATWRREDGVVAIDYEKCIGCRYCLAACPYSARVFDSGEFYGEGTPARQPYEQAASPEYNEGLRRAGGGSPVGNARKCHFCLHRLEEGQLPACVTSCIGHATFFGDANEPDSLVSELIGRPEARRLKEELGTSPRVYYLT